MLDSPDSLVRFQGYLRLLAGLQIGPHWRSKVDASSMVQQTMYEAIRDFKTFNGKTEGELVAWLRRILNRNIIDAARKKKELSFETLVKQSSQNLERLLQAQDSSPSEHAVRYERLERLAAGLEQLPPEQRVAVELKHLHGWRVAAISDHLQKSPNSVAGLLRRGLKKLRELLDDGGDPHGIWT